MQRIIAVVKSDFQHSLRDNLLVYGLLGPLLLALFLGFFLPTLQANSINVALLDSAKPALVEEVSRFADVERVAGLDQLRDRVGGLDDTVGFVQEADGTITIIIEDNEQESVREVAALIANQAKGAYDVLPVDVRDLGVQESPLLPYVGAFLALMALLMGGFVIGFNIIEEKESQTIAALGVTPMRRWELIVGHSITGLLLALFMIFGSLLILGLEAVNFGQVLVFAVTGVMLSILFGFLLGAVSTNQVNGIANGKLGFMLFIVAPLVTFVLPASREFVLYWVPTFWTFAGFRAILVEGATWAEVWRLAGWNLALNGLFLAAVYRVLRKL
ncbi:MAG: ABC transporter permease [Desulforudis sp.]|jgi:ABC-2 type transport system permease protein|nr:ABC transporter permease [Clostridia bacterium]RJX21014.1 MAG: ABC transporter permease [Desulforudis sp.]